jgi:pectate lyase
MYASGGRGGEVYAVTNLNDDGPGSLRDAISKPNRTVIFKVSGTIELKSRLDLKQPNITIAGQTAPGDGICLKDHELFIANTENVIVRFIRSRPGDAAKKEMDALTIWTTKDVIVDHCSMSWSTDSLNDVVKESGNVTVQWCILAQPLVHSVHAKGEHGYATGWDGRTRGGMTGHHNLIAHAASRAPRVGYFKTGRGLIDVRNNVIYNSGPSYGGETDDFNYVGNYYRPGPNTEKLRPAGEIFAIWADDSRMYQADNVFEGVEKSAVAFKQGKNANGESKAMPTAEQCLVRSPFDVAPVTTQSAEEAFASVTQKAGAWPRDRVDAQVLKDVKERTGKLIDTPADAGGYPELKSTPAPTDTDSDGIPDAWEQKHGLSANDAADGAKPSADGYTNLELYLNELAANAMN